MADDVVIPVAELGRRLRRAVEGVSGNEWVEGEVSSLKQAASGHVYFCLKDEREDAVIDCVMYRGNAQRARRHLSDGARVQVAGRATFWAPRGRLQFAVETLRPAGRGALLEALDRLRQRLQSEGLFDAERKRSLPSDPSVVGVVTSASGAAFHDICSVAFRRGGVRIVLAPALVQGEGAPESIVKAIDLIERYPGLDVLIVGRGGGSLEDLMAFNDERVVRRVADARVPVVSAVGHEVDVALTDLAADVRAATPSQAAELVIPDAQARRDTLLRCSRQLVQVFRARLVSERSFAERLRGRLSDPRFVIAERQQQLDELTSALERLIARGVGRRRASLHAYHRRLLARHPRTVVARARAELGPLVSRLGAAARMRMRVLRSRLAESAARLDTLSPLAVLGRGYAITTRADGAVLRDAAEVAVGEEIGVRLHRGILSARVLEPERTGPPKPRR